MTSTAPAWTKPAATRRVSPRWPLDLARRGSKMKSLRDLPRPAGPRAADKGIPGFVRLRRRSRTSRTRRRSSACFGRGAWAARPRLLPQGRREIAMTSCEPQYVAHVQRDARARRRCRGPAPPREADTRPGRSRPQLAKASLRRVMSAATQQDLPQHAQARGAAGPDAGLRLERLPGRVGRAALDQLNVTAARRSSRAWQEDLKTRPLSRHQDLPALARAARRGAAAARGVRRARTSTSTARP